MGFVAASLESHRRLSHSDPQDRNAQQHLENVEQSHYQEESDALTSSSGATPVRLLKLAEQM